MIAIESVSKRYGDTAVIEDLSLTIEAGELFVLVGASGSGKSTLLRMLNRLIACDGGRICIDGEDIREKPAETLRRGIGYVIQSTGLFPHWTVARNIATVPQLLGWPKARIDARVDELMNLLQLDGALAQRHPSRLSGGQQQRVGVARALAADPAIVLMDEPFGALDPLTRRALQDSLRQIQRNTGKTIVFVTHDMDEALRLGDRMALLEHGRIAQHGTPAELLTQPANAAVRDFIGGADLGMRLLAVRRVAEVMQREAADEGAPTVHVDENLQQALARMVEGGVQTLRVIDANEQPCGSVRLADLIGDKP